MHLVLLYCFLGALDFSLFWIWIGPFGGLVEGHLEEILVSEIVNIFYFQGLFSYLRGSHGLSGRMP